MAAFLRLTLLLAVAAPTVACSSAIRVNPIAPPAAMQVSAVVVQLAPEVKGKKENILRKVRAQEAVGLALRDSTMPGGDNQLVVTITNFRTGRWGPTVFGATAELVAPNNQVLGTYRAIARSSRGSRRARIQRCAQKVVLTLVQQMPR